MFQRWTVRSELAIFVVVVVLLASIRTPLVGGHSESRAALAIYTSDTNAGEFIIQKNHKLSFFLILNLSKLH